jgi:hypothetical protein
MTEPAPTETSEPQGQSFAPRPKKRDVHGWVVLDKPVGMTSTHAVAVVKRAFSAKKAGHAGTLDPLASGLLPIALGEATKTVPFVMDGRKAYRFTVAWGTQTAPTTPRAASSRPRRPARTKRPSRPCCRASRARSAGAAEVLRHQDRRRARL